VTTLKARLKTAGVRLYAVLVQRTAAQDPSSLNQRRIPSVPPTGNPVPVLTAQFVSELTEHSGGRMYRRNWDLADILKAARKR
jgi:hypothetical protein